jgi:hypothetical protein
MKTKGAILVLASALLFGFSTPSFSADPSPTPSDSPTISRADKIAIIQSKYISVLNSELARFMAVKKIMQTDPSQMPSFNKILADFLGSKATIEADVASATSDLDGTLAFGEEETVEFNSTLILLEKQVSTKKTISCVKGKAIKKVSVFAPKCPAGFKKK